MVLEILFSLALIILAGYCLGYVYVSSAATTYTDPLGTGFWPIMLLSLLIVLLVINIIQIWLKTPKEDRNLNSLKSIDVRKIVKSRLFWGMVTLIVYALLLPYFGFLFTTFLLCVVSAYILGETRPQVLILFSLLFVCGVFVLFMRGMSIQLPRGTIPFFRNMAIAIESFLRSIGR